MSEVVDFAPPRRRAMAPSSTATAFFDRSELSAILSVYSRKVIAGEWRDYAIEMAEGCTAFAIFRRPREGAAFRIVKNPGREAAAYQIISGARVVKVGANLARVLQVFERDRLRVVESTPS